MIFTILHCQALLLQTLATEIHGEYYTKLNGKLSEFVQIRHNRGFWFNPKSERQGIFLISKCQSKLIFGHHELLLDKSSTSGELVWITEGKVLRLFRSEPKFIHTKMEIMLSIDGKFEVCHCHDLLKGTEFIFKHLTASIFKDGNKLGKASLYLKSDGFFELRSNFEVRWLKGDANVLKSVHLRSKFCMIKQQEI